jgi:hypothetical protein
LSQLTNKHSKDKAVTAKRKLKIMDKYTYLV